MCKDEPNIEANVLCMLCKFTFVLVLYFIAKLVNRGKLWFQYNASKHYDMYSTIGSKYQTCFDIF